MNKREQPNWRKIVTLAGSIYAVVALGGAFTSQNDSLESSGRAYVIPVTNLTEDQLRSIEANPRISQEDKERIFRDNNYSSN